MVEDGSDGGEEEGSLGGWEREDLYISQAQVKGL